MINKNIAFFESLLNSSNNKKIIITGNAGSGKTYLCSFLKKLFKVNVYSTDFRFIGDSEVRKNLLKLKSKHLDAYIDYLNQYSWWNWDLIESETNNIVKNNIDLIENVYDRDTGNYINVNFEKNISLLIEGAILSDILLNESDKIVFLFVDEEIRFSRLLEKDKSRRSFKEILSRFLITSYAEDLFLKKLISTYSDKLIILNKDYNVLNFKFKESKNFIPLEVVI